MRWSTRVTLLFFVVVATCLGRTTAARAASIVVSPTSVAAGGTVTVSGDVLGPDGQPGCTVPGSVLLFSAAFGDLNTPRSAAVGADAHFSTAVPIPAGVAAGSYP